MKSSIRVKYTLLIVGVLAAILLVVFLFMNFGLKPYVEHSKENVIKETVSVIESTDMDQWDADASNNMMRIASQNNFGISIIDITDDIPMQLFSTNFNLETVMHRFSTYIDGSNVSVDDIVEQTDNYVIYRIFDIRMGCDQIECMGHNENVAYVITTSMAGIQESVSIANRFLLYAAIVGLVLAAVLVYIVCRKISNPIIKLSKQSEEISNLDFSGRYEGKSDDEIGILGNNINLMSEHLEKTINELQVANKQLEEDIAEKEMINQKQIEFIGNASHELKTPIALIQGYAEGLKDGIADDPESMNFYVDVITDEASKMSLIVKRLLNLDEIETGRIVPQKEDFDLVEVIKGVIASSAYLSKEKDIEVNLNAPDSLIVNADEFMIEQAVTNYLSNSYNHVSNPGTINVTVEPLDGKAKVSVFNTGENIPEEDIMRIWDKFYKVDKAHTRDYGGSGIGLSIVKSIIDIHEGMVSVKNLDDGVSFEFTI